MKRVLNFFRISFAQDLKQILMYPTSFWIVAVVIPLHSLARIVFLESIYSHTTNFIGYTKYEAYVLFGTYTIVQTLAHFGLYNRLSQLGSLVRGGGLESFDLALAKPIDSQIFGTLGRFNFGNITPFFVGVAIVVYGVWNQSVNIGIANVLQYLVVTVMGTLLFYLLFLFFNTFLFWQPDLQMTEYLFDAIQSFGQYPANLYSGASGIIFNVVLPVTLMAGIPTDFLFAKSSWPTFLMYLGIIALLFALTRMFWQVAVTKYASSG